MVIAKSNSLRKACRNCTRCKRRCVIELPKCQRCRQRNLECVYDLEPLMPGKRPSVVRRSRKDTASTKSDQGSDAAAPDFLEFISSLHMSEKVQAFSRSKSWGPANRWPADTPVPVTQDPEDTRYIISELLRLPSLVRSRKVSPFVHPELYREAPHRYLEAAFCGESSLRSLFSGLSALDAQSMPLIDLLAAMQALMLFIIQHVFNDERTWPAGPFFELLAKWRAILWSSAAGKIPRGLSRWHSWLMAESVRRSFLMSYLLDETYSAWRNGWCSHQLFVDALPFSARGALWLAATPEDWHAVANDENGTPVGELEYFHKFTETFARAPFHPGADWFQKLLLVAHHGKEAVERSLESKETMS